MGNVAGVRRDFDALEKRRFAAMHLLEAGLNQSEVARRVKVARQTVARWAQECRSKGKRALKKAGRAGRKPLLNDTQRRHLVERLLEGPERLGYETPLWTCPRVAHLIEQEFGILYHKGHVWKILVSLGWSPQRPTGRARERNEEEIRTWKRKKWPAIKKSAPRRAHDRLRRRKRIEPAAASVSHLGAPRANPHPRVQFQLEESVCGCWTHVPEFLFPAVRWCGQESAGYRFSAGARAAHSQAAAFGLGPLAGPPQPSRARLYRPAQRQNPGRVSSPTLPN